MAKVHEYLSTIEQGMRQLERGGRSSMYGRSAVSAGAARLRRLVDVKHEMERTRRRRLAIEPVDLERLAAEVIDDVKATIPFTGIISVAKLGTVAADRSLLRTALRELLGNAVRFSDGIADARVDLQTFRHGDETVLVVRDNGIGFEDSARERLFRAYETLHPGSPRCGVGMGLVLVQLIAERHGGRVRARSTPGSSTEFFFVLPAA